MSLYVSRLVAAEEELLRAAACDDDRIGDMKDTFFQSEVDVFMEGSRIKFERVVDTMRPDNRPLRGGEIFL